MRPFVRGRTPVAELFAERTIPTWIERGRWSVCHDAKERLLISGLGTDRVAELRAAQ